MQLLLTIFKWMLASSVIGGLMVCIILFVKVALKNRLGAKWHYYIWILLVVRLLVPYLPQSPLSIFNTADYAIERLAVIREIPVISAAISSVDETLSMKEGNKISALTLPEEKTADDSSTAGTIRTAFKNPNSQPDLLIPALIWLTGLLAILFYTMILNIRLAFRIKGCEQPAGGSVAEILQGCKSFLHIRKNIPVVFSVSIRTPACTGLIRPRILLPHDFVDRVNADELRHVFLHELVHYRRKDILINMITVILKILYWFNPLIWYGFFRMKHDCEAACDAVVLSHMEPGERIKYGYTIIHLLKIISPSKSIPGAMGILTGKTQIKRRITMISLFKKESLPWAVVAVILVSFIGFVCLTNPIKGGPVLFNTSNPEKNEKLTELNNDYNNLNNALLKEYEKNRLLEESTLELQQLLKKYQMLAGTTDIEGTGIIVTLEDSATGGSGDIKGLVHDSDIRNIVNELINAGVDAVSVNDERLVATSEIKASGSEILINNNRYSAPFIIKAIGNPEILEHTLKMKDGFVEVLKTFKIDVNIEVLEKLTISGYKGTVEFEYAKPVIG